ncbi:hypothetical protein RI049_21540 [Cedecea neteri]|uniref:hypothetical protein n=1 Tax=Cedecea neteri TaxID=158822 RepID=UPI002AA8A695|nr:hypothetical protein [Cedecea neteri]WPU22582.1 hypothetical protein RI049_21540 [Cedecea neteri]
MWSVALKLLKNNWQSLLVVIALTGGGVWLGTFITRSELDRQALAFSQEKSQLNSDFNQQKTAWDQERIAAANRYAADLKAALDAQQAWQQKADGLSRQLAEREAVHTRTVTDLKARLKHATEKDGDAYTGLGPASLQLWREALGYPGSEGVAAGNGLPATSSGDAGHARDAGASGGRLSPAGIVSFSSDYGKWCLVLRDRLQAINNYYNR